MDVRSGAGTRLTFVLTAVLALGGCLTEVERPETATYRVDAAEEVRVVTSSRFLSGSSGVELVEADTVFVTGPHEGSAELGFPTRFYIRAVSLSDGNVVSMEVFIGDRQWYDHTQTLTMDAALEFVYGFSGSLGQSCAGCAPGAP